jgi:hypothetical protein
MPLGVHESGTDNTTETRVVVDIGAVRTLPRLMDFAPLPHPFLVIFPLLRSRFHYILTGVSESSISACTGLSTILPFGSEDNQLSVCMIFAISPP